VRTKKNPRQERKFALSRARSDLHHTIFDMYRMLFDLTNALVFATSGDRDLEVSDLTFYHLKRQAADVAKRIESAEQHLKPYLKKRLAEPDKKPNGSMDTHFPTLRR
jgi:hypothetical protein